MKSVFLSAALAASFCLPAFALAQDEDGASTPQELAVSLFSNAVSYAGNGDYESARRMLEAVLDIKPGHPAVLARLYRFAMDADRPEEALSALERLAAAGLVFDVGDEASRLRAVDAQRYADVSQRLEANNAPAGRAERFARVDLPDALIEGVAIDIETDRLYLSSVAQRQILMLEPFARDEPVVFADESDGLWSVFGLAVDDRTRMVWAASGTVPQTPLRDGEEGGTALFAFDLMSGELFRRYEIDGAGQMADFVVRDGRVYISDSRAPRVYALDSLSGELRVLAEDDRFVSLQGVALSRGALYVADYAMGIWRIDLTDGSADLVTPGEESLMGIDGLLNTRDGRLVAVRNGARPHQMMAIDLDRDGLRVENTQILLRAHSDMRGSTEPTLVDLADGRAWLVANSAWPLFPEDRSTPAEARPATVILELDLP